jgi:tetratricopeptide (TPR) repeat protein
MARALNDLGVVRQDRGDLDEAADLFRESLDVRRRLGREDNLGIAITTSNLSVVLYRRNDLEGATAMAENALDLLRRTLGGDHQRTLVVQSNLAAFQSVRGDHEGSAAQHRDILERRIRLFGSRHASVAYSRTMLANELVLLEDYPAAEQLLVDALDVQREAGITDAAVMSTLRVLGDTRRATGRDDAALANYDEALAAARSLLGDAHSDVASLHARRATQLERLGRMDEAARAWDDALGVAERADEDAGWGDELRAERDAFVARTGRGSG